MTDSIQRPPGFIYTSPKTKSGMPVLCCEGVPLANLAKRFGTPLYVYSAGAIRERVQAFESAFAGVDHLLCYSVKANSNLGILRLLEKLGSGFDVVSGGELARVARVNRRAESKVVFSGVGKTQEEMESAIRAGILLFNLESEAELGAIARSAAKLKRTARIAFRVNPDVPADTHPYISTGLRKHKFGVPLEGSRNLYMRAAEAKYLKVAGVSVHIGSQIRDQEPFFAALERVADLVRQLRQDGHEITYVDAGGGLGIDYDATTPADFRHSVVTYAQAVCEPLKSLGVTLLLEPGRSIIGAAGVLLTRVLYRKTNGSKKFVVVDAGMNDLIRPSLYQAAHQITPIVAASAKTEVVDVVGPVCESGDFFARDRELPGVEQGDLLAILDAGAYGMALASNYNSRPRPAEVLVQGKAAKLVRKRESIADLMRAEL